MAYVTTLGLNFMGHVGKYSSRACMDSIDICESLLANQDFMEWNEVVILFDWLLVCCLHQIESSISE